MAWRGRGLLDLQPIGFGGWAAGVAIAASRFVVMVAHKAWVAPYLERR